MPGIELVVGCVAAVVAAGVTLWTAGAIYYGACGGARWQVTRLCRVPEVSRSEFYARRSRGPSAAEKQRKELAEWVATIRAEVKGRYGSPRVHAELVARGTPRCVTAVARVVREAGLAARTKREVRQTTDSIRALPVAGNVLDRGSARTGRTRRGSRT